MVFTPRRSAIQEARETQKPPNSRLSVASNVGFQDAPNHHSPSPPEHGLQSQHPARSPPSSSHSPQGVTASSRHPPPFCSPPFRRLTTSSIFNLQSPAAQPPPLRLLPLRASACPSLATPKPPSPWTAAARCSFPQASPLAPQRGKAASSSPLLPLALLNHPPHPVPHPTPPYPPPCSRGQ
jgi:hypothetical protein